MAEIEQGYRQTDIGMIPENWKVEPIGNLFVFKNGLNKAKEFFGYGTPIVNYMDVYSKDSLRAIDIKGKVHLSNSEILRYEVKVGDVFFTRTSETPEEVGISSVVIECPKNTVFSGFVLRGRPINNKLINEFKSYCFQTKNVRNAIIQGCTYTTRALTNGTQLSKILIPIPNDKEQTAIATALSDVDNLIAALDEKITKKQQIKQGAMQQLLTSKKRLPGFNGEWVEKKLGEIAEIKDGTHQTPHYVNDGMPFYSVESVTNNEFKKVKTISIEEHKLLTKMFKIEKGDVLMTRIGSIGVCKFIDWELDASFYVSLALLKFKDGYSAKYFTQYSKTSEFIKEIEEHSLQHATPKKINLGKISLVKIRIPLSFAEQTAIAQVLTDMDNEISQLEADRNKYEQIKVGMMQQLLTGKIRLFD